MSRTLHIALKLIIIMCAAVKLFLYDFWTVGWEHMEKLVFKNEKANIMIWNLLKYIIDMFNFYPHLQKLTVLVVWR